MPKGGGSGNGPADGTPTSKTMDLGGFAPKGNAPEQCNVKSGKAPSPGAAETAALKEIAGISTAKLSSSIKGHEVGVDLPKEGYNDAANLKV